MVLRRLGMLLQRYISENLTIGRFGGEEFVLIFEGTDPAKNEETLEGIRVAFSEEKYDFMDRMTTFSAGLITCTDKGDFDAVLELADRGLYESKKTGKNRITIINDTLN
ncbi:MAG: GGDEF domain-containing protein [Eubacterium sp.]|nr:GGDEF domain-containing protein [Eubacterium sp.]